jgi:hypothetical protein
MEITEEYCRRYIMSLKDEAEKAKKNRMDLNRDNFAMYQMEHDFSHKAKGQSKEVLSKVRNATESSKAFFQQALADLDDWFRIIARDNSTGEAMLVRPEEMQKLLSYMLKQADYFSHVGASAQSGLLGSLAVSKVRGCLVPKPKYRAQGEGKGKRYKKHVVVTDDKTWELRFDTIRQEDYYPDPTGAKLFEIEESLIDLHTVKQLAQGEDAIYDKEAVDQLKSWGDADLQESRRARETGQNITNSTTVRPRVKITEFIGTVVDQVTGDIMAENVMITLANHSTVIRKPTPNPLWHQRSPIVAAALIEVVNSVWGIAMMDAGTKHNRSLIELFNLMLDSAMKAVWGINQIRTDVLDDPNQITDSIRWGTNLRVSSALPIGGKVMEPVVTGEIPTEVLNMFNLMTQETLTSMRTNDLRMGAQSMRAVKATEVVASENAITSEFQGIAKNFEEKKIQPELELACYTICQNWDRIDSEVFISLFGRERGEELAAIEPQEVFVQVVNGLRFEVYGISMTLRRQADFRKWTTLLQTIGSSEVLIESFLQKYSFEKLLGEIMSAIDLNKTKIEQDMPTAPASEAMAQPGGAPGATPNAMSQIPQAAAQPAMSALEQAFSGAGGNMNMPSSQAIR